MKLLCSSGTFTRHPDFTDYRSILKYAPELPVDGLEVLFYESWYGRLQQIAADLVESGLSMPVVHCEKSIAFFSAEAQATKLAYEHLSLNCYLAQEIGAKVLVFHLWGWRQSDAEFDGTLDALPRCVDIAEEHGITLAVEITPSLITPPLKRAEQVMERDARCRITLDTEFLASHGQLDAALEMDSLWEEQRVVHIHIKDYDGQWLDAGGNRRYVHPGEGTINFPNFFAALEAREYNGTVSLESPVIARDGSVDLAKLRRSLTYIRELIPR
jgi:sugar phosphate isomerase/epimerase